MDNRPAVAISGLTFGFGDQEPLFDHFNWSVGRGEMWSILGPSGCGKTTLLYLLAGLQQPTAGSVVVNGHPVPRPRATTGLILQDHGLLPWATARQNARLGLRMGKLYRNRRIDEGPLRPYPPHLPVSDADSWLDRLEIGHLGNKYPAQLSGGERQRVAIARTLALRPNLLLMDEPFSALDAVIRENLQDLVVSLQGSLELTTIIVTHSVDEAAILGQKVLLLSGPPNRSPIVLSNPGAGQPGYRSHHDYLRMTTLLRGHLARA